MGCNQAINRRTKLCQRCSDGKRKTTLELQVDGRGLFVGRKIDTIILLINDLAGFRQTSFKKIIPLDLFPTIVGGKHIKRFVLIYIWRLLNFQYSYFKNKSNNKIIWRRCMLQTTICEILTTGCYFHWRLF
jgi:hypothetical protein